MTNIAKILALSVSLLSIPNITLANEYRCEVKFSRGLVDSCSIITNGKNNYCFMDTKSKSVVVYCEVKKFQPPLERLSCMFVPSLIEEASYSRYLSENFLSVQKDDIKNDEAEFERSAAPPTAISIFEPKTGSRVELHHHISSTPSNYPHRATCSFTS